MPSAGDKKGQMFISFVALSHEDDPQTSEELFDLIHNHPPRPEKQTPMTLKVDAIEKAYEHPIFSDLSEICTIEGEIISVDEDYVSFNKRLLIAAGQEPDTTWNQHVNEDGDLTFKTWNN